MRLRLFSKLGLSYLLLLLAALGVVYVYTTRVLERNFLESTYAHLGSLIRVAESRPPEVQDIEGLRAWAVWMAQSGARVTVIASDGTVLAESEADPSSMENHARRPEIREAFLHGRGRAARFSNTVKRDLVYVAKRYEWGPNPPVVLRIASPQVELNAAIAEVRGPMASVSLLVLVIGGALSLVFSRLFSSRVLRLREFAIRVAEGDFTPAPAAKGGDEIAELTVSLNETANRLSTTIHSLEEERNQSRAILSSMSEGVAVVDGEQKIRFSNRAFREELRLDSDGDAMKGRPLAEVLRHDEILTLVQEVLARGERLESEIETAGPDAQDFLVRAAPVGDEGAVLVLLDITDIRRLERVRRDFVANVSHEIRTPLTAIQGFTETLLRGALEEPENRRRFAEIIREHAARLARLTEDLLKLSQIEAGKLDVDLKPFSVREVIVSCISTAKVKADAKRQAIAVDAPEDIPRALVDPHALTEILQNLLDNAIQYSREDTRIEVRATANESEVRIAVVDRGIGIPVTNHARIFERFFRVDAARSREVGGTGLGLAIARHLAESMRGRIELESEVSKGSTFTVVLTRA